jgi:hypothetical protein
MELKYTEEQIAEVMDEGCGGPPISREEAILILAYLEKLATQEEMEARGLAKPVEYCMRIVTRVNDKTQKFEFASSNDAMEYIKTIVENFLGQSEINICMIDENTIAIDMQDK